MKVAIVYDRVNKWGGAERVLLSLHKLYPHAPLFTSVYDREKAPWAKVFHVKTSFLQEIPFIRSHHEFFSFLMPFAFWSFSFKKFDVVISVTSEFAKGIRINGKTTHVCVCLTPTRYLWSGYSEYFPNILMRRLSLPLVWVLRKWDRYIATLPDAYVAISDEVKQRIQRYYKRDSMVVYPAVARLPQGKPNPLLAKDYFLVVARLSQFTSYKRVDLAIRAASKVGASLVIVGDGDKAFLQKFAGPTVQLVGKVNEKELSSYYQNCRALIFPGKEDFGLAMVEAMSFGKPVIAYKKGGALEIIKSGKTGMFFEQQTVSSLIKVLKNFHADRYNSSTCKNQAQKFSEKQFAQGIKKAIKKVTKKI